MGLLKNPLALGLIAAAVAWWFMRKKADCHCDAAAPAPTVAPPISPSPFAMNVPPPAPSPGNTSPPLPGPTLPAPVSWSAQCQASGGSPSWDPTRGAFCLYPEAGRVPAPAAVASDDGSCARYGGVLQQDGNCLHCGSFGGTTLPDGSCCIPANGCNPNPPAAAPPPVLAPAPVWSGYVNTGPSNYTSGPPAPTKSARQIRCETTNGEWGNFAYDSAGNRIGDCLCPRGSYQNGDGFCVSGVV